ncbi:MAG: hypothetical protein GY898_23175 [Proteobacteria bacterium]|nr:hypothetical protein [Pseudomonadota bacterium]
MTAAKKQDPKELEELEVHGGQQVVGLVDDYIRKAVSQLVVVSGVEQEINRIIGNRLTSIVEEQLEARTQEVAEKILEQELRRRLKHLLEGRLPFTLGVTIKARDSELLAAAVEETKPKPKPKRKRKKKVIRKVTP